MTAPEEFNILRFDTLDSTNAEVRRMLRDGDIMAHRTVVISKEQTEGRGRMDREWVSPPGNIYLSIVLRVSEAKTYSSQLPFVAAVAIREALIPFMTSDVDIYFKWPNDLLIKNQKLSGILIETVKNKQGAVYAVVGVGINVESHPIEGLRQPATSLNEWCEDDVDAEMIITSLLWHMKEKEALWKEEGFEPIRKMWCQHALGLGEQINVVLYHEECRGVFKDINSEGSLCLDVDGEDRNISVGDVYLLSEGGAK